MKKGFKLLTLAMLFALPLASCGDNSGTNNPEKKEEEQHEEGGEEEQPELLVTSESETYRIACKMLGLEKEQIVVKDANTAEYEDEADIWIYEMDTFTYYMTGIDDDKLNLEGLKAYCVSLLPENATLNEQYTYGEEDYSGEGASFVYGDYTYDNGEIAYNFVIYYYEDEDGIYNTIYIYVLYLADYEAYSIDYAE